MSLLPARVDVVVVGAGVAGLAAAKHLHAKSFSVAVLEAQDDVGGRYVAMLANCSAAMTYQLSSRCVVPASRRR
ncbi:MAG: FAD-dependent oxidoreductase [Actinobacteria bacterium]|nr:FAD-dependent oxidoreductase [Actinomycetota bacterium]